MSQSQPQTITELWDETQRLNEQVAALQQRLARYENVDETNEQAAPVAPRADNDAGVWNVWPYCWALNAHRYFIEWFHSFHGRLEEAHLAWRNKQARIAFWQTPHPEEITLKLL